MLKQEKEILDQEVRVIAQDPSAGEEKKGTSRGYSCTSSISGLHNTCLPIERSARIWNW